AYVDTTTTNLNIKRARKKRSNISWATSLETLLLTLLILTLGKFLTLWSCNAKPMRFLKAFRLLVGRVLGGLSLG
ncbi:hypothetical protein V2J09_010932, partial [Rumex salicifolius]